VLEQQRWAEEQYAAVAHEPAAPAHDVPLTSPIPMVSGHVVPSGAPSDPVSSGSTPS